MTKETKTLERVRLRDRAPIDRSSRKPYIRPVVSAHRPLAAVTLGGSPGTGDSGPGYSVQEP